MSLPGWSAYVLASVLFGAMLAWFLWTQWKQKKLEASHQAVPGPWAMKFSGPAKPAAVGRAVGLALAVLQEHTGWSQAKLAAAVQGVLIQVQPTDAWMFNGRKVGGLQLPGSVLVGPNLSALCHELAHLAQAVIDHIEDNNHLTWESTGIWAADAAYRAEL